MLTVSGDVGSCPATEPEQVYYHTEPYPAVCHDGGGDGVLIYMADTGLLPDPGLGHPWLAGVRMGNAAEDEDTGGSQTPIPPYTAHGTFIAGVTRCMAPAADIIVTNAFKVAGSTLESDLVPRLVGALGHGVDIFHLTVAAPSRADLPLISFEAWLRLLRQYKGTVCLAAAGNSDTRRPHWPGAFHDVLSVGALAADWRSKASFSNYGGWVDVYAPGRDLINAYATGTYECKVDPYNGQPADVLRHGQMERHVVLHANRDRADRLPDVAYRGECPAGGGRAAGRGPGPGHSGRRRRAAAGLSRGAQAQPGLRLLRGTPARPLRLSLTGAGRPGS